MMVKKYQSGRFMTQHSLLASIGVAETAKAPSSAPVIAVVGAGGKTTTIRSLAGEYMAQGIPVIVTTTTHMLEEKYPWFLLEPSLKKAGSILESYGMVWLGTPDKRGKMKAPPRDFLGEVLQWGYPTLIEADGAKRLPMKAPAEHEPVILPETTHVINIYGLEALGLTLSQGCFRPEQAAGLLKKKPTDMIREADIVTLALASQGGRKNLRPWMQYHVILNQADTPQREKAAEHICRLAKARGFTELTITAHAQSGLH